MWTLAKVRNGFADLPNEKFHTFAVKRAGIVVGELKWVYRPKNAGGYAWRGMVLEDHARYGAPVSFYDKNKNKVLDWFKEDASNHMKQDEENGLTQA
jgi:hypothetical protein